MKYLISKDNKENLASREELEKIFIEKKYSGLITENDVNILYDKFADDIADAVNRQILEKLYEVGNEKELSKRYYITSASLNNPGPPWEEVLGAHKGIKSAGGVSWRLS